MVDYRHLETPVKRTWIKRESKSHRSLRMQYEREKEKWFKEHPRCQFAVHEDLECGLSYPITLHHKMGRGKYLADPRFFQTLCLNHHAFVEAHKKEARRLGYILYK